MKQYKIIAKDVDNQFKDNQPYLIEGHHIMGAINRFVVEIGPKGLGAFAYVTSNIQIYLIGNGGSKKNIQFRVTDSLTGNCNDWGSYEIKEVNNTESKGN